MTLNALIVGCGSLYGKEISNQLQLKGYTVYGISGTITQNPNILTVDWETCDIQNFEKFIRKLPQIDVVVFNQNSPALIDEYYKINSLATLEVWKRAKRWSQSHYVNCILPTHILHTLGSTNKFTDQTVITWILSSSMFGKNHNVPVDYIGQKYQNYIVMKTLAATNPQIYTGICPGHITDENRISKAVELTEFIVNSTHDLSGNCFILTKTGISKYQPLDT